VSGASIPGITAGLSADAAITVPGESRIRIIMRKIVMV
jgi:hypothetical protein